MSTKEIINTENGNVVLLSEGEYNNIMKAVRNAEYLAEIDKAAAQFEAGKGQIHDLIEVEDDEWDPNYTKATLSERERIEHAESSGFIADEDIDWDHLEKYAE